MLQQTLNELRATIEIRPHSPLLIKDGRHHERGQKDQLSFLKAVERTPKYPRKRTGRDFGRYDDSELSFDMAFVWRHRRDHGDEFYIPGSSLRGVVRHAAEQIVARWRPDLAALGSPDGSAGQRSEQAGSTPGSSVEIYAAAGPIERCFGTTNLRGRWVLSDAPIRNVNEAAVMVRDGVGINRHTGAAAEDIKFSFETITGGVFVSELVITNYELWQLGLLAHTLAAIDGGSARIGYGTRRGLGRVSLRVSTLHWRWYQKAYQKPQGELARIPALAELADAAALSHAYTWHDGEASDITAPQIPLVKAEVDGLVPTWASPLESRPDPWLRAPWPQLGPLLPQVLNAWPQWHAHAQEEPV